MMGAGNGVGGNKYVAMFMAYKNDGRYSTPILLHSILLARELGVHIHYISTGSETEKQVFQCSVTTSREAIWIS
jgi:hypothetical protein